MESCTIPPLAALPVAPRPKYGAAPQKIVGLEETKVMNEESIPCQIENRVSQD